MTKYKLEVDVTAEGEAYEFLQILEEAMEGLDVFITRVVAEGPAGGNPMFVFAAEDIRSLYSLIERLWETDFDEAKEHVDEFHYKSE
jgi:hypothetical protein